ncbi:MAG TPA: hypothetical protein VKS60_11780, partial [Stellaceae bacterium]|nr:hypothetical protein [Stellaceae bacterium]
IIPIAVVFGVAFNVARIRVVDKTVVQGLVDSLSVDDPAALGTIRQSNLTMPKSGEGMLDSFDIGSF